VKEGHGQETSKDADSEKGKAEDPEKEKEIFGQ
jgi:hypothetical protein